MIILGIDPGINSVGYGVIYFHNHNSIDYLASGLVKTSTFKPLHFRLAIIIHQIEEIINNFKPNLIGMEEVFVNNNVFSSIKLCHARGAIMSVIGKLNYPLKEMSPNLVKKTITGIGHSDKNQVLSMVKLTLKNPELKISLDESDALAVACTAGIFYKYDSLKKTSESITT